VWPASKGSMSRASSADARGGAHFLDVSDQVLISKIPPDSAASSTFNLEENGPFSILMGVIVGSIVHCAPVRRPGP